MNKKVKRSTEREKGESDVDPGDEEQSVFFSVKHRDRVSKKESQKRLSEKE